MTPAKDRKAAERQRKQAAGLVRLEIWAPPECHAMIKVVAARLIKPGPLPSWLPISWLQPPLD